MGNGAGGGFAARPFFSPLSQPTKAVLLDAPLAAEHPSISQVSCGASGAQGRFLVPGSAAELRRDRVKSLSGLKGQIFSVVQDGVQLYPKASSCPPCLQKGFTLQAPGLLNSQVVLHGKGMLDLQV